MGAEISPGKSHIFASNQEVSAELGEIKWDVINTAIMVVRQFGYLGAQISTGMKLAAGEMGKMMHEGGPDDEEISEFGVKQRSKGNNYHNQDPPPLYVWGREC